MQTCVTVDDFSKEITLLDCLEHLTSIFSAPEQIHSAGHLLLHVELYYLIILLPVGDE